MERMYEKLLRLRLPQRVSQGKADGLVEGLVMGLADCTIIVADNVAEYLREKTDDGNILLDVRRELPNVAPPFKEFFVETFERPPEGVVRSEGVSVDGVLQGARFWAFDLRDAKDAEIFGTHADAVKSISGIDLIKESRLDATTRWGVVMQPVGMADDIVVPYPRVVYFARGDGSLSAGGGGQHGGFVVLADKATASIPRWQEYTMSVTVQMLLAICFMHCKNVKRVDNLPSSKTVRRLVNAGQPIVRFTTLVIDSMKEVLRTEGHVVDVGLAKALHLCRGHFRHYTAERPLFGKKGMPALVFVQQHLRGTWERGAVAKWYVVNAMRKAIRA